MAKCTACWEFLSPSGAATCKSCPSMYHKSCVNVPDYVTAPKEWVCPPCKKKQRKDDSTATPREVTSGVLEPSPPHETHTMGVDSDVRALRRDLAEYMAEQREFRNELRSTIASMGLRMDGIERRLEALEQLEVPPVTNQVVELQQTVVQLKLELDERDQEAFITDLEIGPIPEEKGENMMQIIKALAVKMGVDLDDRDVVFAERIGSMDSSAITSYDSGKVKRTRRVVVRIARRQLRDDLLRAARTRRNITTTDIGLEGPPRRIYVNERLSKVNRRLFHLARAECAKQKWRYAWTKRGRIFVRQAEGEQGHSIRSDEDLVRVFGTGTVC